MNAIVKNPYFKLLVNNIILSILKEFYLKKVDSNIITDIPFLHSLNQEIVDIKIVNIANCDHNISLNTLSTANNKEKLNFWNNENKNNDFDKYSSSDKLNEGLCNNKSDSDSDILLKGHCNYY